MKPSQRAKPPTKAEFALALSAGEGQFLEFKESASDSLARGMVAFANAEGGRIYIGVADDKSVVGAEVSNRALSRIQDIARHCDPPVEIALLPFKYEGRSILLVEVQEGTRKPHACSEGYFLRTGPSSQKMSRDELLRFVRSQGPSFFDESPCLDFKYPSDFSVQAFKTFLAESKVSPSVIRREDLLVNMGAAKRDGKRLVFNNAGVVFFAKNPGLFHIQSRITCILFQGTERTTILDRKDFDGVVADNVEGAMTFLKRNLPLRYEITGLKRKEIMAVPEDALREAVLNAVIHRDYFQRGGVVTVEIHRDKVKIVSPGGLVPGLSLDTIEGRSLPRNPRIAELFLRMEEGERAGTGIARIRQAVAAAGLEAPVFAADTFFTVAFPLPATPGHVPAKRPGALSVVEQDRATREAAVLRYVSEHGSITRRQYVSMTGKSHETAWKDLVEMVRAGLLAKKGRGRSVSYVLGPKRG